MAASHHGDTPYSGNSLTSVPVTPYTTSVDVNPGEDLLAAYSFAVVDQAMQAHVRFPHGEGARP